MAAAALASAVTARLPSCAGDRREVAEERLHLERSIFGSLQLRLQPRHHCDRVRLYNLVGGAVGAGGRQRRQARNDQIVREIGRRQPNSNSLSSLSSAFVGCMPPLLSSQLEERNPNHYPMLHETGSSTKRNFNEGDGFAYQNAFRTTMVAAAMASSDNGGNGSFSGPSDTRRVRLVDRNGSDEILVQSDVETRPDLLSSESGCRISPSHISGIRVSPAQSSEDFPLEESRKTSNGVSEQVQLESDNKQKGRLSSSSSSSPSNSAAMIGRSRRPISAATPRAPVLGPTTDDSQRHGDEIEIKLEEQQQEAVSEGPIGDRRGKEELLRKIVELEEQNSQLTATLSELREMIVETVSYPDLEQRPEVAAEVASSSVIAERSSVHAATERAPAPMDGVESPASNDLVETTAAEVRIVEKKGESEGDGVNNGSALSRGTHFVDGAGSDGRLNKYGRNGSAFDGPSNIGSIHGLRRTPCVDDDAAQATDLRNGATVARRDLLDDVECDDVGNDGAATVTMKSSASTGGGVEPQDCNGGSFVKVVDGGDLGRRGAMVRGRAGSVIDLTSSYVSRNVEADDRDIDLRGNEFCNPYLVAMPDQLDCGLVHPGALSRTKTTITKDSYSKTAVVSVESAVSCAGDASALSALEVDDYLALAENCVLKTASKLLKTRTSQMMGAKHDAIVDCLSRGKIISARPNEPPSIFGHENFLLELMDPRSGTKMNAMFKPRSDDENGWHRAPIEWVAYNLNLMLGMDYIPPVAYRKDEVSICHHRFKEGAVIYFVPNVVPLKNVAASHWGVSVARLLSDTRILDVLLNNSDRHHGHFLYGKHWASGNASPVLIDHAAGFRKGADVRMDHENAFQTGPLRCVHSKTYLRLRFLDEKCVRENFQEFLSDEEICEFMQRRDMILAYLDKLVEDRGYHCVVIEC